MKTLQEMREMVKNGQVEILTTFKAKELKGKKIQVISFGYAGQDHTDEFVVGKLTSELSYYRNLKEECFKNGEFKNRAEYWKSYMSEEQLKEKRTTKILTKEDGSTTYIYSEPYGEGEMWCGDDFRTVFYIITE